MWPFFVSLKWLVWCGFWAIIPAETQASQQLRTPTDGHHPWVTAVNCAQRFDVLPSFYRYGDSFSIRTFSMRGFSLHHLRNLPMTNLAAVRSVASYKRRSNRMTLSAPVGLSGEDRQKATFTVPARAINLNRHGAAVQLNRELSVGTTVVLKNKCGTQLSARVVSHLKEVDGQRTYGIEFVDQDERAKGFWGINFPTS
jgi:hypothetical protein